MELIVKIREKLAWMLKPRDEIELVNYQDLPENPKNRFWAGR